MSLVTKVLHNKNYPAIDAASPEQSQKGRRVLITGGSAVIGRAGAEAFVTAGADTVVITSRSGSKADKVAKEIQAKGEGTKVFGYEFEASDAKSVHGLWDGLKHDGIEIDILILNATPFPIAEIPSAIHIDDLEESQKARKPSLHRFFPYFESAVGNHLLSIDRFRNQGPDDGKVLIYTGTNAIHYSSLPVEYTQAAATRIALTRMLSDLAANTPVNELQILSLHPGFVSTPENEGMYPPGSLPFDDGSLCGNFYVWASTKKAAFLHGRFVWVNWDVDELIAMKAKLEADPGFLRVGLQGVASQDFPLQLEGMKRSV